MIVRTLIHVGISIGIASKMSKSASAEDLSTVVDAIERLRHSPPVDCHHHAEKQTGKVEKQTFGYGTNGKAGSVHVSSSVPRARRPVLSKASTVLYDLGPSVKETRRVEQPTVGERINPLAQSFPAGRFERAMHAAVAIRHTQSVDVEGSDDGESYGLECALCLEEFEDQGPKVPRNLQCGHTFCTGDCLWSNVAVGVEYVYISRARNLLRQGQI